VRLIEQIASQIETFPGLVVDIGSSVQEVDKTLESGIPGFKFQLFLLLAEESFLFAFRSTTVVFQALLTLKDTTIDIRLRPATCWGLHYFSKESMIWVFSQALEVRKPTAL
jgi:hypothetical protein